MPKYVAKDAPESSDDEDHQWYVEYDDCGHLVELNGLRDAEAHIIAWALNIVAMGGRLEGFVPTSEYVAVDSAGTDARVFDCFKYDGPTEGVAPLISAKSR
jgi:hypothetical protein